MISLDQRRHGRQVLKDFDDWRRGQLEANHWESEDEASPEFFAEYWRRVDVVIARLEEFGLGHMALRVRQAMAADVVLDDPSELN